MTDQGTTQNPDPPEQEPGRPPTEGDPEVPPTGGEGSGETVPESPQG